MKKRKSAYSENERALANAPIAAALITQEIDDLLREIADLIVAHTKMSAKEMRRWWKEKNYLKDDDFGAAVLFLIQTRFDLKEKKQKQKPDLSEKVQQVKAMFEAQSQIAGRLMQIAELKQKRAKLAPGDDEEVSRANAMLNEISSRKRKPK